MQSVIDQLPDRGRSHMNACIGGGIVNIHFPVLTGDNSIAKYNVGDVADPLFAIRGNQVSAWAVRNAVRLLQIGNECVQHIS
ncbi:hypothetical protein D3C77_706080 [compost metagenome]